MAAGHMVVMLCGAFLIVGRIAGQTILVMRFGHLGAVHHGSHFARVLANNPSVESDEDSDQQDPWQERSHNKVWITEESTAASTISDTTIQSVVRYATEEMK